MMCEICMNWVRCFDTRIVNRDGIPVIPHHHPNCPHYNDSLMDVWVTEIDGNKAYCEHEVDARESIGEEGWEGAKVYQTKMHREVFENLPDFEGF